MHVGGGRELVVHVVVGGGFSIFGVGSFVTCTYFHVSWCIRNVEIYFQINCITVYRLFVYACPCR